MLGTQSNAVADAASARVTDLEAQLAKLDQRLEGYRNHLAVALTLTDTERASAMVAGKPLGDEWSPSVAREAVRLLEVGRQQLSDQLAAAKCEAARQRYEARRDEHDTIVEAFVDALDQLHRAVKAEEALLSEVGYDPAPRKITFFPNWSALAKSLYHTDPEAFRNEHRRHGFPV